jgi:DeoR/GlpR family transcriptional regulator of sugar metabolism
MNKKKHNRDEEIIELINNNKGIRIKDLAKLLSMWDSNLRKKIKLLAENNKVERFNSKGYTCVRIKD